MRTSCSSPELTAKASTGHRSDAAVAAALVPSARPETPESRENSPSRPPVRLAIDWLSADLDVIRNRSDRSRITPAEALRTLRRWKADTRLSAIRDPSHLQRLSDEDRAACEGFWQALDGDHRRDRIGEGSFGVKHTFGSRLRFVDEKTPLLGR